LPAGNEADVRKKRRRRLFAREHISGKAAPLPAGIAAAVRKKRRQATFCQANERIRASKILVEDGRE